MGVRRWTAAGSKSLKGGASLPQNTFLYEQEHDCNKSEMGRVPSELCRAQVAQVYGEAQSTAAHSTRCVAVWKHKDSFQAAHAAWGSGGK